MARMIPLSGGKRYAIVDDEDFEWLNQFKWSVIENDTNCYAIRNVTLPNGRRTTLAMHKEVARFRHPDATMIDHIDGNGLNNQSSNLRPADGSQNSANRHIARSNTGVLGVYCREEKGNYEAKIQFRGVPYSYRTKDFDAACKWREEKAKELFGEFAPDVNKIRGPRAREATKERPVDRPFIGVYLQYEGHHAAVVNVDGLTIAVASGHDPEALARLRDCAVLADVGTRPKRQKKLNFDRDSYTDAEIQAARELVEKKVAAYWARKGLTATSTLGISYRVKAA